MATETGPDLTIARQAVEALMDDTCDITIDSQGSRDDVLNTTTGALAPPVSDVQAVYSGRCKVSPISRDPRSTSEGGVEVQAGIYNGSIPWDSPLPAVQSVLTVTSSRRDPNLVGRAFTVTQVSYGTFLVARKMTLELR